MIPNRQWCDRVFWTLSRQMTPGLVNAQRPYMQALSRYVRRGIAWLDLGCGHRLVPEWMPQADQTQAGWARLPRLMAGIDGDFASLCQNRLLASRVMGDVSRLPFADQAFDLVTANMVIEHLQEPSQTLTQIQRVLKPGGHFLFHTPNVFNPMTLLGIPVPQPIKNRIVNFLEARAAHDVYPTHYRMNRPKAIRRVAGETGLKVHRLQLIESSPETVMLGPLVAIELLWIRLTRHRAMESLRSNIIAVLQKPVEASTRDKTDTAVNPFIQSERPQAA